MSEPKPALIHDWDDGATPLRAISIQDETLREGLQSPFVADPADEVKLELLHLIERIGIEHVSVGIPAASDRAKTTAIRLCREVVDCSLRVRPNAGGRTVASDVHAIIDVANAVGTAPAAFLFIGSSPIRQYVEDWDLALLRRRTRDAVGVATLAGLEVTYILEDTTRARPEQLEALLTEAIDAGARHVCLCDTVGCATPAGTRNLVEWSRELLDRIAPATGLDWHGHDDRGLGLANALAAIDAGVDRVHTTALGLGERAGNTATEQLLVNLRLRGGDRYDMTALPEYVQRVSAATGVPIAHDAPVVGSDVFRTAAGVHAAAIEKARARGDDDLADRVYCGVPASWLGRAQEILIGPLSGASNARAVLREMGAKEDDEAIRRLLDRAKASRCVLTRSEVAQIVAEGEEMTQ